MYSQTMTVLDRGLNQLIWIQLFRFFPWYLIAISSLWATHYIQSFLPFYAKELTELIQKGTENFSLSKFLWIAVGIVIFRTSSRFFFFYPARVLEKDIRVDLLERLENISPLRYKNFSPGQLLQIIFGDTEQIRALVGFAFLQVGNMAIALLVLIPKIMEFNSQLVWALLPMMMCSLIFIFLVVKARVFLRKTQDTQGDVQDIIMETYSGKKTVKNFHAEKSFMNLFENKSKEELNHFHRAGKLTSLAVPLIPLGVGLSLLYGGYILHSENSGAGSLVLFSAFVFLFLEPLMFLSWIGIVISRSIASWDRIKEIISCLKHENEEEKFLDKFNPDCMNEDHLDVTLKFWNKSISAKMNKFKWTILIGKTGCGKSTLLLQMASVLQKQNKISFVSQHPYLYNDTLEKNIFLGKKPSKKDRKTACQWLEIFHLFSQTKNQMEMEMGEYGKKISGGEAKRICLVRSLMSDADILLWDDPFSSVDLILEKKIIDQLKNHPVMKRKTLIICSHRLSTVKNCDKLIHLKTGEGILEEGNPEILLKKHTRTYEYFKKQMV